MIENQVPNGCCTEAWKRRAHWVGSQLTSEMRESIAGAEDFLQTERPVRRYGSAVGIMDYLKHMVDLYGYALRVQATWKTFGGGC